MSDSIFDDMSIDELDELEELDSLEEEILEHYGTPRHSGRYPWGSGQDPYQNSMSFISYIEDLNNKGLTEKVIAERAGMSMRELRDRKTIARNEIRRNQLREIDRLRERGWSNVAIGEKLGINESQVRALSAKADKINNDQITATADALKENLKSSAYLDVGAGTEYHLNVSNTKLNAALTQLQTEGYRVDKIKVPQLGTVDKETTIKVLSPPGTEFGDIVRNKNQIGSPAVRMSNDGLTFDKPRPPIGVDPKRVGVNYAEDGGSAADGTIYLRRGISDIDLGDNHYAQVRIQVGDSHFLKGVALYSDDLPAGKDMVFNTNKSDTGNKLDAMKPLKDDPRLPFGSVTKAPRMYEEGGKKKQSALNIVNEEGDWSKWSKSLSSQMLSKQQPSLAKQQLGLALDSKKAELEEIRSLENATVRKQLLISFADGADAAAVDLKAKALPRTESSVILPINSLKDTEIYAPRLRNGEEVALIRHPHGGRFEIPILKVNNRNPEGKRLITNAAKDAVGINARVAERLSGADFDGDTVLVIPNDKHFVRNQQPLKDMQGFDPKKYKVDHDTISPSYKQKQMGMVSNLITDMTIKGADTSEIARAVKHSMVVIDSEKHQLDWRASERDHAIGALKKKYQYNPETGGTGASTMISRSKSDLILPNRKDRPASEGGAIDKDTGERRYVDTGYTRVDAKGNTIPKTTKSTKMAETSNAHSLSSGTPIEKIYGDYANGMKTLANSARKEYVNTQGIKYSPAANKAYKPQVETLRSSLNLALANAPLERQAQLLAGSEFRAIRLSNPGMEKSKSKKLKGQLLQAARDTVGAKKPKVSISDKEWEAVQNGAISDNMLKEILRHADPTRVKELATPRATVGLTASKESRIRAMAEQGYPLSEIADTLHLGVSTVASVL